MGGEQEKSKLKQTRKNKKNEKPSEQWETVKGPAKSAPDFQRKNFQGTRI